ncbi:MAG TPA: MG2 domain-containing protein [Myxococcota bacterium]|nr:MG2 domain-containing protein [Myxococcota bacterium]
MRTNVRWQVGVAAVLAGFLALGCECGGVREGGGGALPPGTDTPSQTLAPLPEPPVIPVQQAAGPGGELTVVAARPQGEARGALRPTVTFSRPIVALGALEEGHGREVVARLEPAIPGEWRWLGSASVEFVPRGLYPYATHFRVIVPAGLKALDGAALAKDYTFEFETPRPEVQSVSPGADFAWLTPRPTFTLVLNQPVQGLAGHARLELGPERRRVGLEVVKEVDVAEENRASEQGRRYARASFEERGFKNRQTRYELAPVEALPLDAEVELVVAGGLPGKDGPLGMALEHRTSYRTYGPMRVREARACFYSDCPYGPMLLLLSNPARIEKLAEELKARLVLEPPVEVDWDAVEAGLSDEHGPYVMVPGRYRPGSAYRVRVAAGFADEFGQAAPAFSGELRTSDLDPFFDLGSGQALLEADGDGQLPVESANLTRLELQAWVLDPAGMARWLGSDQQPDRLPAGAVQNRSLLLGEGRNVQRRSPIPLRDFLPAGQRTGLLVVMASAPELPAARQRWRPRVAVQLTDLAVHGKLGPRDGLVWVTRLSSGEGVAGAELELYDRTGARLWTGTSTPDGTARVPGLERLIPGDEHRWGPPFALLSARKDGDVGVTLSSWEGGLGPWAFGLPGDWDGDKPRSLGLVFSERGIYRPGESVQLKGLARVRRLGDLATPQAGTRVKLALHDSRGQKLAERELALSRFGTFQAALELPKDGPLGTYTANAELRVAGRVLTYSGSFRVEEYRAPQFQVDVTAAAADAVAGEPLQATVLSRYLFGGAMAEADTRWSALRCSTTFSPPGNEGFEFGVQTWWWDDETPEPGCEVVAGGQGRADAQGVLALEIGRAEAPAGKTASYTVEAEVTDVNRQRQANRVTLTVHPAAAYAGVRVATTGFAEVGKPARVELVAAAADGARLEGQALELKVLRRTWKSIRKQGAGHRWFTVSEPVEEPAGGCAERSAKTPVACEVTPSEPGFYILEASLTDEQGRKQTSKTSFYAVGQGWVSWQRNDTDRIDLVADKTLYDVGESARILVKSPYPRAEALLTVEREGVQLARRIRLEGSATALDIPITEEMIPNAFVGVVLVRGRVGDQEGLETGDDPGRPGIRVGYAQLKVERRSKRLQVTVTPDAADKRPRDKVRLALEVKDHRGQGAPAELTVWAVDEGVLRLTDYQLPDPIAAVHPDRGLSVRLGEPLIHLLLRKPFAEKGQSAGGGGGGEAVGSGFRSRFKTTALWVGDALADAGGRAQLEFELPDNLTTYRLMAVAVTEGDRFGAGQSRLSVSKPLLALPALPRLARVGDAFEAGVVVHTKGVRIDEARVVLEARGARLLGGQEVEPGLWRAEKRAALADGRPREVRFRIQAEAPGTAVLRFQVEGGGERDGVEAKVPVQLPVELETVATYGDTQDAREEAVAPPGGVRPGLGGLELTLASTIMGGFDEGMRQLVDYPYGCLEQLSSRLVPFVALRELHGKFGVPYQAPGEAERQRRGDFEAFVTEWLGEETLRLHETTDPDEIVKKTVKAVERLQNPDGSYRYWPSSGCASDWGSAYAVLSLFRASELGYPVDGDGLRRGQRFLADQVAAGRCAPCHGFCAPPPDSTRVFALYTLARTRAPKPSYYNELHARRDKLPLFAQAMLADAMFVGGGERRAAEQLLQEVLNRGQESAGGLHFEEVNPLTYAAVWSSDTRTTAIVLQTLTDISPAHPFVAKIARHLTLVRKGSGRFRNTQEAAFALMALTEVVRTKEAEAPDFTARVLLGGKEVAARPLRGRSMKVEQHRLPMAELGELKGQTSLRFEKQGAGVLYYGARLRYAPAELPMTPLDQGLVVQRWFEPYQGGGQATAFKAGDLVRVRVRVGSPQERQYLVVEVPLPAGLEAVDTSLASTARIGAMGEEGPGQGYEHESAEDTYADQADGESPGELGPYAASFWSPFNHVEVRDDRVLLFADHLPPGVHVSSFVARATTPGRFLMKPARAEEMYTPEVFGRSAGGVLDVLLDEELAAR